MISTQAPLGAAQERSINLRALLEEMIQRKASDLHITAGDKPKLRVDGEIVDARTDVVLTPKDTLQIAYSILTEAQKKRFETEDELDFSFGIANLSRFRGNVFKQRGCVSMAVRQVPVIYEAMYQAPAEGPSPDPFSDLARFLKGREQHAEQAQSHAQ